MAEKQSSWGRVFLIERIEEIDSANTTVEREHIEKIINKAGSKFSAEPIDRRTVKNIRDIKEAISDAGKVQNAIVHFSGHGEEADPPRYELEKEFLEVEELSRFFNDFKNIRCVVFNFCNSLEFAKMTAEYVECAIGVAGEIASEAAIGFAEGFYKYLRDTEPDQPDVFDKAFDRGKNFSVGDDPQKFEIFFSQSLKLKDSELNVEIIKPEAGSLIPYECQFSGTFRNLPENSTMWLYVLGALEGKFYLVEIGYYTDNETWEISVPIGDENGGDFRIGVIVVDGEVTKPLRTVPSNVGQPDLPAFVGKFGERSVRRQQSI